MFPLSDYFQVLKVYFIIALLLWIPPLLKPWKSFALRLNERLLGKRKKNVVILLYAVAFLIISLSFILISLFNNHLARIQFEDIEAESSFFTLFAGFTFILMPISMGIITAASFIAHSENPRGGDVFLILFAHGALGMAGSFYHDFLWCGTRTNWYTEVSLGGYDFDVWLMVVGVDSNDYQLLGISQFTLCIILVVYFLILMSKFNKISNTKPNRRTILQILTRALFSVILFGFFLFIIDSHWVFDQNVTIHALFIGIPLIILLFNQMGRSLAAFCPKKE